MYAFLEQVHYRFVINPCELLFRDKLRCTWWDIKAIFGSENP